MVSRTRRFDGGCHHFSVRCEVYDEYRHFICINPGLLGALTIYQSEGKRGEFSRHASCPSVIYDFKPAHYQALPVLDICHGFRLQYASCT